jgi:uncharacterized membrane protein
LAATASLGSSAAVQAQRESYTPMGYISDARTRAGRRRSPWNLLLIPCYVVPWLLLVLGSLVVLGRLYGLIHAVRGFALLPDTVGGILMAVGSLFAWLGPAMIVANLLVAAVPRARRALDQEAALVPGTDRASANRSLLRLSSYVTPIGVAVALAGLFVPW